MGGIGFFRVSRARRALITWPLSSTLRAVWSCGASVEGGGCGNAGEEGSDSAGRVGVDGSPGAGWMAN